MRRMHNVLQLSTKINLALLLLFEGQNYRDTNIDSRDKLKLIVRSIADDIESNAGNFGSDLGKIALILGTFARKIKPSLLVAIPDIMLHWQLLATLPNLLR